MRFVGILQNRFVLEGWQGFVKNYLNICVEICSRHKTPSLILMCIGLVKTKIQTNDFTAKNEKCQLDLISVVICTVEDFVQGWLRSTSRLTKQREASSHSLAVEWVVASESVESSLLTAVGQKWRSGNKFHWMAQCWGHCNRMSTRVEWAVARAAPSASLEYSQFVFSS